MQRFEAPKSAVRKMLKERDNLRATEWKRIGILQEKLKKSQDDLKECHEHRRKIDPQIAEQARLIGKLQKDDEKWSREYRKKEENFTKSERVNGKIHLRGRNLLQRMVARRNGERLAILTITTREKQALMMN